MPRIVFFLFRIKNAICYHCKPVENGQYWLPIVELTFGASVTIWSVRLFFLFCFLFCSLFCVKLCVRACAHGSQYRSHSCLLLLHVSNVVKSHNQRLALANVDRWTDEWIGRWIDWWMDAWMHGQMMDGWVDGWMMRSYSILIGVFFHLL